MVSLNQLNSNSKWGIDWRGLVQGILSIDEIVSRLMQAKEMNGASITAARAERMEREAARQIRREQDQAYQESLAKDREKERLVQAKKDKERLQAQNEQDRLKRKVEKRQQLMDTLPAEPASATPNTTKVVFRLPDGTRAERRFLETDTVEVTDMVYKWSAPMTLLTTFSGLLLVSCYTILLAPKTYKSSPILLLYAPTFPAQFTRISACH
jgi:hypothetical protein